MDGNYSSSASPISQTRKLYLKWYLQITAKLRTESKFHSADTLVQGNISALFSFASVSKRLALFLVSCKCSHELEMLHVHFPIELLFFHFLFLVTSSH